MQTFRLWLAAFTRSRDTLFDLRDPLPALLQGRGIFHYLSLARRHGLSPLEASTFDIEWNGETPPE
jgi:hypothetical protein